MTVDPAVVPGFALLLAELVALAAVGYVVVRVALRQADDRVALAQGLVVGPALWGLIVNFVLYAVPGLAGAAIGWGVTLTLGAVLAWRAPDRIRPRPRVVAGFAVAVLALFWVVLPSRQLLSIPDAVVHLGLAASIRAGGFPPEFFWTPDMPAPYHYGTGLLIGLLKPPAGPDLALVTEVLDAWMWTSFVLVVVTALLRRASRFAVLLTAPLLLTAGAWTFIGDPVDIVRVPLPAGIPTAGIRASLTEIYWPFVELPLASESAAPPDIWRFVYTLSYSLGFVVLQHAAQAGRRSWPAVLTLASLVGFLALLTTTLAPMVLILWAGLEAVALVQSRLAGSPLRGAALRSGTGLVLAVVLLAVGGGTLASALTDSVSTGLTLGWTDNPGWQRPLGSFDSLPGGVALLRGGPVIVAGVSVLLARRDRLVLALAVGACALVLASVALNYASSPVTLGRFVGHARNFALLSLLLAISARLTDLRSLPLRWRYAAGGLLVVLVTWPTVALSVRTLGMAIGQGVEVANARPSQASAERIPHQGRFEIPRLSDRIAGYIWERTPADARIFSATPAEMSFATVPFATGRPNASGFVDQLHILAYTGSDYLDVFRHLEPAAIRRLGFDYVYATDAWVADLPDRAARWLADPDLFELLIRDGTEALYRVRPAFLDLKVEPHPESFEALRQAVPASATVYLPAPFRSVAGLRGASALSHARLLGVVDATTLHLLTPWLSEPVGGRMPDLVITWSQVEPWMFPPAGRRPIWWNDEIAVYAPTGAVAPIMPPRPEPEPPPVSVYVSDVRAADGHVVFTATFDNHAPERWTGQEWVVVAGDASPWAIPTDVNVDGRTFRTMAWFAGQTPPTLRTTTLTYQFDILAPSLIVRDDNGAVTTVEASATTTLGAGAWTLAVRLQHEWQPNYWREAAFIPVMRIEVSEFGEVSYEVFDAVLGDSLP